MAGPHKVLHLRHVDRMAVRWNGETVPIAPYFFPPEVVEEEAFESDDYILGRDFFLEVEVTFRQAAEQVILARRP